MGEISERCLCASKIGTMRWLAEKFVSSDSRCSEGDEPLQALLNPSTVDRNTIFPRNPRTPDNGSAYLDASSSIYEWYSACISECASGAGNSRHHC
jgi:hypothetical protein